MNAIIPKTPRAGDRLSAVQMAQVMQAIRRYMPIAGNNIRVSYTLGGTVIHAKDTRGGGGYSSSLKKLIPWTCEYHTEFDSSGSETYANYGFFLPHKGTFQYRGIEVDFTSTQESAYTGEGVMGGSEWRCFSDIGFGGSGQGFAFCELLEDSGSAGNYHANIVMEDAIASDALLSFPVAWIYEETDSAGNVTRKIQQLEYGNEVLYENDEADLGCFRAKRTGSGSEANVILTHCYWEQENITCFMSDVEGSSWNGKFVWLEIDSSNFARVNSGDFSALQTAEVNDYMSVVPLYKFDAALNVEIDFRAIPTIQEWMPYSSDS